MMDSFDLLKFRNALLKEGYESELDEKEEKIAKPSNATNSFNFAQNDDAGDGGGAMEEGQLEEMASFYKVTDDSPEAKAAIVAAKEKYKPGSALYNTLDTLEKTGEIDYKALSKETGKDIATWNNPKSREVLEKDLAAFIASSASPSAIKTGRPVDPNKPAAAQKAPKAAGKIKITNPKVPTSAPSSSKLADLAPSSVFDGGVDDEDVADEMAAMKSAKGNKRLGTTAEKIAQITKEMKSLIPLYQKSKGNANGDEVVEYLKNLTAEKKALEKKLYKAPKTMSAADLMGGEEA
jgi:hypothetical protein